MHLKIVPLEDRVVLDAEGSSVVQEQLDLIADPGFASVEMPTEPFDEVYVIAQDVEDYDTVISSLSPDTKVVTYDPKDSLDTIMRAIKDVIGDSKVDYFVFANHSDGNGFSLNFEGELSLASLEMSGPIHTFWKEVGGLLEESGYIDLLHGNLFRTDEGMDILMSLENVTGSYVNFLTDDDDYITINPIRDLIFWGGPDVLGKPGYEGPICPWPLEPWDHFPTPLDPVTEPFDEVYVIAQDVENYDEVIGSLIPDTKVVTYNPNDSLETIMEAIKDVVGDSKVDYFVFVNHSDGKGFSLNSEGELSLEVLDESGSVHNFWKEVGALLDESAHIRLLNSDLSFTDEGLNILKSLENITGSYVDSITDDYDYITVKPVGDPILWEGPDICGPMICWWEPLQRINEFSVTLGDAQDSAGVFTTLSNERVNLLNTTTMLEEKGSPPETFPVITPPISQSVSMSTFSYFSASQSTSHVDLSSASNELTSIYRHEVDPFSDHFKLAVQAINGLDEEVGLGLFALKQD